MNAKSKPQPAARAQLRIGQIQAYIFAVLAMVYIASGMRTQTEATQEESEEKESEEEKSEA